MPNSRIPAPDEALEAVSPITPEVYRAFEHGITKASLYFKSEGITPHDPWAYSMLVKLHAREHLRQCPNFASVNRAGTLETLWLVCPRNFNRKTGEITVHWDLELPNPIFGVASPSQAAPTEDLPYRRKKQKDAKGG